MAIEINGKKYRNLQEQVQKNKEDIEKLGGGEIGGDFITFFDFMELQVFDDDIATIVGLYEAAEKCKGILILTNIEVWANGDPYHYDTLLITGIQKLFGTPKAYSLTATIALSGVDDFNVNITVNENDDVIVEVPELI